MEYYRVYAWVNVALGAMMMFSGVVEEEIERFATGGVITIAGAALLALIEKIEARM